MPDKDVHRNSNLRAAASRHGSGFWRPDARRRLPGGSMSWLAIAGALILAVISLLGENGLTEFLRLSRQRDQLAVQHAGISLETAELRRRVEALREDPVALETLARERYNMRREGERVILLVTEEDNAASQP